ncbi:MAG TPA: transposase [Chitinophagaceae bacterium]|jgi:transposase-like protein
MQSRKVIKKNRCFSLDFKLELVRLFELGKFSVSELSKLYGVSFPLIYRWIYKHSKYQEKGYRIIEMKQSSTSKIKALEQKVKDLERLVGQKQIKIDFLNEMIDVASQEFNIDIKKKPSTPPSSGSKKSAKS